MIDFKEAKWRVLVIGSGVLMVSVMTRLEWSTAPILSGWLLGYITFPLLWGYPRFSDKKEES